MPIYEFYCNECHTVYKFFSRVINTETIPSCPQCKNPQLQRQVSVFAAIRGGKAEETSEGEMPAMDEAKMEKAMAMLAREADQLNEDDPRQAARLMRKLSEAAGLRMDDRMEEALRRLERGEDPEQIESELGDLLEGEEPFDMEAKPKQAGLAPKPKVDDRLYDL